ncbi:MAG: GGDEF domain-containing protein [Microthrixaceae bacterium]|nr:GGDEF domain-containing protein [Microthrixaceae bacterium]
MDGPADRFGQPDAARRRPPRRPTRSSLLAELAAQRLERTLTWSDALIDAQAAAEIDPLTGLGNRRVADRIIATVPVGGGLIVLDLDDFKETNDRCGHAAGDAFLRYFAQFLVSFTRSDDRVARLGGDEFVIGITDTGDAGRLSRRLVTEWNRRGGGTVSAGSAVRAPDDSPHDVFRAGRRRALPHQAKRLTRQDLDA